MGYILVIGNQNLETIQTIIKELEDVQFGEGEYNVAPDIISSKKLYRSKENEYELIIFAGVSKINEIQQIIDVINDIKECCKNIPSIIIYDPNECVYNSKLIECYSMPVDADELNSALVDWFFEYMTMIS